VYSRFSGWPKGGTVAIDPKTGLNKNGTRTGTTDGTLKAARANAKRVGAKKGQTRAAKNHAWSSDATLAVLVTEDGHTLSEVEQMVQDALEDVGINASPAFKIAAEQLSRTTHRIRYLSAQGDELTIAARAELLELERSLQKQMASLLMTPEAQIRNGVPERRAAAERAAKFEESHPRNRPQSEQVEVIRALVKAGQVPGCTVVPVAGEPLDPAFSRLVRKLITEGRIPGAFLAAVPDRYGADL
jgi:hypothetical protein